MCSGIQSRQGQKEGPVFYDMMWPREHPLLRLQPTYLMYEGDDAAFTSSQRVCRGLGHLLHLSLPDCSTLTHHAPGSDGGNLKGGVTSLMSHGITFSHS